MYRSPPRPLDTAKARLGRVRRQDGTLSVYAIADLIAWSRREHRAYWTLVLRGWIPDVVPLVSEPRPRP